MCVNSRTVRQDLYSEPRTLFNFPKMGITLHYFCRQNLTVFNESSAFSFIGSLNLRSEVNRLVGSHDNHQFPCSKYISFSLAKIYIPILTCRPQEMKTPTFLFVVS